MHALGADDHAPAPSLPGEAPKLGPPALLRGPRRLLQPGRAFDRRADRPGKGRPTVLFWDAAIRAKSSG
eukprot:1054644-Pyramimonas_sp.AAC.1